MLQPESSAARNVLSDGLSGTTSVLLIWVGQIWKRKEERTHVVKSQAGSTIKDQQSIRMPKHHISIS